MPSYTEQRAFFGRALDLDTGDLLAEAVDLAASGGELAPLYSPGDNGHVLTSIGGNLGWAAPGTPVASGGRIFDVNDYGADPTGANDSSAAFEAAYAAAYANGGGTVFFEGKFKVNNIDVTNSTVVGIWFQGGGQGTILTVLQGEPLFNINGSDHHSNRYCDFQVTWAGTTTTAHTNAVVFKLGAGTTNKSLYNSSFANITVSNGYRLFDTAGMLFWGNRLMNITMSNMYGGIWRLNGSAGQPINSIFGMYINAEFCSQYLLLGNALVATFIGFEVNKVNAGAPILSDGGAGDYTFLGETSIEGGIWGSNVEMFQVSDSQLHIQKLKLEGTTTARMRVFYTANTGSITCDRFHIGVVPSTATGDVYFAHVGQTGNSNIADPHVYAINGKVTFGKIRFYGGLADSTTGIQKYSRVNPRVMLTDWDNTAAADAVEVLEWSDQARIDYAGDADYTCDIGGPCRIIFRTALTGNRKILLPRPEHMPSGMTYYIEKPATGGDVAIKNNADSVTYYTIPNATKGFIAMTVNRGIGSGPSSTWEVAKGGTWT